MLLHKLFMAPWGLSCFVKMVNFPSEPESSFVQIFHQLSALNASLAWRLPFVSYHLQSSLLRHTYGYNVSTFIDQIIDRCKSSRPYRWFGLNIMNIKKIINRPILKDIVLEAELADSEWSFHQINRKFHRKSGAAVLFCCPSQNHIGGYQSPVHSHH